MAQADFREAQRHYKDNKCPTHSLISPTLCDWILSGSLAEACLVNLLQQRSWFLPVAIFKHGASVQFAQFSPDGTRVVTASDDKTARLWDATTGKPLGEAMTHQSTVFSAAVQSRRHPGGDRIR